MHKRTAVADSTGFHRRQRLRVVSERKREPLARKHWKWIGLLGVGYFVTTFLSRFFVIRPEILAPIWLPAGVLLGAMLLLPWSAALLALGAAFAASIAGNWITHVPLGPSIAFSFANCACGLFGTVAIKRFSRPAPRVSELRGVVKLMVLGAVVGNGLGATIGAYIVHRLGQGHFGDSWLIWFLSNAWGILIVVPILSEWGRIRGFFTKVVPQAWVELLVMSGILGTVAILVWTRHSQTTYAFVAPFLIFPLLVWIALRFGTAGAAVGAFVVSSLVLVSTGHGIGRFAGDYQTLHTRFVELQVFMSMATICSLLAAAIMSDRERAEISLRYSNSIVESSDAAIIGKTLDGIITSWNPGAERMYGYRKEEAIGKNISFLVPENHPDEMPGIMQRLRSGARIADYETVRKHKNGTLVEVAVNISPIHNTHGRIVGASSIARDITDKKRAERELRETHQWLQLSFDAADMGAWDWNLVTDDLRWFGRQEQLFGFAPGTFNNRGESAISRIHPEDVARVRREIADWQAEHRREYEQEFRVVWPDGSERWISAVGRFTYEDARAVRCIGINRDITERKLAEKTLRQTEESLARTQELSLVMPLHVSLTGEWLRLPQRFCEFLGYTHDELIGTPFKNVTHPDDFWEDWAQCQRLIAGEIDSFEMEKRFIRKDGAITWGYINCSAVKNEAGQPIYFFTYVRDINKEKMVAEALADSEEALRTVVDSVYDGIVLHDETGAIVDVNKRFLLMYGLHQEDLASTSITAMSSPSNGIDRLASIWQKVLAGQTQMFEWKARRPKDGSEFDAEVYLRRVRIKGREVILANVRDITERKQAEANLRESEERFRSLYENAAVGIEKVAVDGRLMVVNPALCRMLGYTQQELLDKTFADITHPEDRVREQGLLQPLLNGERTSYQIEKRYLRRDGSPVWVHITSSAVTDPDGKVLYRISVVQDISERKQAEAALRESEERLRLLIEHAPVALAMFDRDMRYLYVSERWRSDYKLGNRELRGLSHYDVFPEISETWKQVHRRVMNGEVLRADAEPLVRLDGSTQWVRWEARPWRNVVGNVGGLVIFTEDITDRKQADEALRESESRFRTTFENAAVGMAQVALDGRWLRVNERLCEIVGYTRKEMESMRFQEVTHPDDLANDVAKAESLARGEIESYSMEKRYIHKDGHTIWVNLTVGLQQPTGDQPAYFISAVEDITDRKRAEHALRKSEQRLRVLTEALPQLVWTADAMGNIDYVNRRWCAFTGQTRQQALGHGSFDAVHPEDVPAVQENWLNAVVSGTQHQLEMRLRSKDGQYRWFLARGVPLRNEEGNIERWFGTCTDIHDMKMAQQALVRSEKLASVGRMAMTIAHEINNPLAAVMNTLFLMRSEPGLPTRAQQFLEMADGELRRISHITRQALGFYRESSTPKVTSVSELLDSVTELLKAKIGAKRLNVVKDFKSNVEITAISGELRQVFSNLVSNAIDALDTKGQLRLRVSRSIDAKGQRVARISIADNGHGISPTALPHIFEPFFTTKDTIGTGLGLWVSKQIIDKHKGCIRVRSSVSPERHGTVFSVVLPMQMEADSVTCPTTPATMAS